MLENKKVMVLDAGNSAIKIALFENGEIIEIHRFSSNEISEINSYYQSQNKPDCIISSVLTKERTFEIYRNLQNVLLVDQKTPLPIHIEYKTPETLGIDRICNAVAMAAMKANYRSVSIDIGTCIKFDVVNEKGVYLGGSISPGIQLRYKSLNDFTANLPLLNFTNKTGLIGQTTNESIHSGVINGMQSEITQMIKRYQEEYEDLTFFMTGGDMQYFDIPRKNNIFVDENLTLKGLYQIYLFNAH